MNMSSTNFNVGLNDERSSSRILKPPGGGHSDIFGAPDNSAQTKVKPRYQSSSITDCFRMEETVTKTVKTTEAVEEQVVVEKKCEEEVDNTITTEQNGKNEQENQPEKQNGKSEQNGNNTESTAPPRVRVPPGGFSSGFW